MTYLFYDSESYTCGKDGNYRPNFDDANEIKLVCIRKQNCKLSKFFNMEREPLQNVLHYLETQVQSDFNRDKRTIMFIHYAHYDTAFLTSGSRSDFNKWHYISCKPFVLDYRIPLSTDDTNKINSKQRNCKICRVPMNYDQSTEYYVRYRCPKCRRKAEYTKSLRILDFMNFFNMSLLKVGQIVNQPKLQMPNQVPTIDHLRKYCENDVIILEKAWNLLLLTVKLLGSQSIKNPLTISKLGYNLLQKFCLQRKHNGYSYFSFLWKQSNARFPSKDEPFVRKALRGGRSQIFARPGTYVGHKLDANSLYPYICASNDFPDPATERILNFPDENVLDYIGCSDVELLSPDVPVPYLPINYYGKRHYPHNTEMRSIWTNHEIKYAINKCNYQLLSINKSIVYDKLPFNIFNDFYKALYAHKKDDTNNMKEVIKLIMNSTTGKFAQKNRTVVDRKTALFGKHYQLQADGYELANIGPDGRALMEKKTPPVVSQRSYPIIYAHITAYARTFLYEILKKIPADDLLMCATDSVGFLGEKNFRHFDIGTEMGQWKIVGKDQEIEFFNNGCFYRFGDDIKANGIRRGMATLNALRQRESLFRRQLYTMKMALKSGDFDNVGKFFETELQLRSAPRIPRYYDTYIEDLHPEFYLDKIKFTASIPNL